MMRAVYDGQVLAEASRTVRVEGNHYFPPESLHWDSFVPSSTRRVCPWKGIARYHSLVSGEAMLPDAAWSYPHPTPLARRVRNQVAFDPDVRIEGDQEGPRPGLLARLRATFDRPVRTDLLPVWRIGVTGGVVGILCCVGPTVLALFGVVSAGTAFAWATDLYGNYAWWFRLGGLAVIAVLVWLALRRRDQCSIAGVRRWRWRLLGVLAVAGATYGALYGVTTWLGRLA